MAIYRFSMKHGSTGNGSSGGAHARYILREEQYSYASHQLVYSESGNMPSWVNSPTDFWDAADEHERKNARVYTEFEVAFPRELSLDQQIRLAQDFVAYEIADLHHGSHPGRH